VTLLADGGQGWIIRLADTDGDHHVAINRALQLEPMDEEHWTAFTGAGGGGHGGAAEAPGPAKVATYPKFYDAVLETTSTFTSTELSTEVGKTKLKEQLLARFAEIAETDAAEAKAGAASEDPTHVGPPYHVLDVFFTKYVVN
ncbi:MAG: hypothetical protein JWM86_1153, partial [Thermoleophilia bacterium]|nr:hypothetical protein [Thermoleophilia bacterium]